MNLSSYVVCSVIFRDILGYIYWNVYLVTDFTFIKKLYLLYVFN